MSKDMMNKTGHVLWPILFFLVIACACYFYPYQSEPRECNADVILVDDNFSLHLLVSYSFNDDNGAVFLRGEILKDGKHIGNINRATFFSSLRSGNVFYLRSMASVRSPQDTFTVTDLQSLLPKFHLVDNEPLVLTISPKGKEGWIFSAGKLPYFFCKKAN